MTDFFMKIIERPGEKLVAACDKEIIDRVMLFNGVKIKASSRFYGNELASEKEFLDAVKYCTSANVIGVNIVKLLVKNRMIHPDAVLWIEHPDDKKKKIGHAILIT